MCYYTIYRKPEKRTRGIPDFTKMKKKEETKDEKDKKRNTK